MVNRPDGLSAMGGDTVQMQQTAAGLRGLGLEVEECFGEPSGAQIAACDVVHLLNLQTPDFTRRVAEMCRGKPIALSTIYWDFGAAQLIARSPKWSLLSRLLGRRVALTLAQRRVESAARSERDQLRRILELAHVWLPNSVAEIGHLQRLGAQERPVQAVPNAVDAVRFDPARTYPAPEGLPSKGYLLVAARVEPDKNQLALCRALAGSDIPVVLCGGATDAEYLRSCESLGARYLGPLQGDALVGVMAHAKVHALPSFRETPGLANLEAAALGCAIVSTQEGSAREYFGDDAQYCDPARPSSIRDAVQSAWSRPTDPSVSERIRTTYTWQRAAEATQAAYELILKG